MVVLKRVVRKGKVGHLERVAPRKGYTRFVPSRYKKN